MALLVALLMALLMALLVALLMALLVVQTHLPRRQKLHPGLPKVLVHQRASLDLHSLKHQ